MSEELVQNAQRLTREYFSRYVAPFQPPSNPRFGAGHPRIQGGHDNIQSAPASGQLPPGHPGDNH